jgi:hypothetical protein
VTVTRWQDIDPDAAAGINLRQRADITAPINEAGERCPWPWESQRHTAPPTDDPHDPYYKCPHCGATVAAGAEHIDYAYVPPGWHDKQKTEITADS